jgi:hypothetical protein
VFFADDATQSHPSRQRVGPLVATGGLFVNGDKLASLEHTLNFICSCFRFPGGEEFKWSPRRTSWMHQHLLEAQRREFLEWVMRTCADHEAIATVLVSDTLSAVPHGCTSHDEFVAKLLIHY